MAAERADKKEKKEKKSSRSDDAGAVTKVKKDKKEKKEKKEKLAAAVLDQKLQEDAAAAAPAEKIEVDSEAEDSDAEDEKKEELPLERTVVSFAIPLADEKGTKKVFKTIRKSAKNNTLKRGVKEVVKCLRKSPASSPSNTSFPGVVIIAGDISPADVISHIPVLCEDHNVPFLFVSSRAELGAAAKTKRPTSVVMILETPQGAGGKKAKDLEKGDEEEFKEAYKTLVKYAQKEYAKQGFWVQGESKA
ncbi:L30e-like protein [Sarocladium strictum]